MRAYYALKEALKCNYENWMVWDNLMVVSVDCGCFEEVIIHLFVQHMYETSYLSWHKLLLILYKGYQMLSQINRFKK